MLVCKTVFKGERQEGKKRGGGKEIKYLPRLASCQNFLFGFIYLLWPAYCFSLQPFTSELSSLVTVSGLLNRFCKGSVQGALKSESSIFGCPLGSSKQDCGTSLKWDTSLLSSVWLLTAAQISQTLEDIFQKQPPSQKKNSLQCQGNWENCLWIESLPRQQGVTVAQWADSGTWCVCQNWGKVAPAWPLFTKHQRWKG